MEDTENFLNQIYHCRIEELSKKINQKWKEEQQKIKNPDENYDKKISCYTEESYKQGFIDGMNLMMNSLKTER